MKIAELVELLHRSSTRMMDSVRDLKRDSAWLAFFKKEVWIHLGLTIKLWWRIFWNGTEEED